MMPVFCGDPTSTIHGRTARCFIRSAAADGSACYAGMLLALAYIAATNYGDFSHSIFGETQLVTGSYLGEGGDTCGYHLP